MPRPRPRPSSFTGPRCSRSGRRCSLATAAVLALLYSFPVGAQGVKVTAGDFGLGLGNVPRLDGLRLNYRDQDVDRIRGLNLTLWSPHEDVTGEVQGLAVGLPLTGGHDVSGVALGLGIQVNRSFRGAAFAPLGLGAGGDVHGIMVGGLGVGAGEDLRGIVIGGLGAGAGGSLRGALIGGLGGGIAGDGVGLAIGGLGVGFGGDFTGVAIGGLGVGGGGHTRGLLIGGLGAGGGEGLTGIGIGGLGIGTSGDATGLLLGGLGAGAGGRISGVAIGGLGIGAGEEIRGLAIGGVGVGAPTVRGVAIGLLAGGLDVEGFFVAPAHFKVVESRDGASDGVMRGVSVSAYNRVVGRQHGLTIGIVNIADQLEGVQVGLINIAKNKRRFRVMPFVNWN